LRPAAAARATAATAATAADGRACPATAADGHARTAASSYHAGAEASRRRPALPAGHDFLAPGGALHHRQVIP
jgi:hypothetical protein